MAACGYCGTSILFGGVKDEGNRYCNEDCHHNGLLMALSYQLPHEEVEEVVRDVQNGQCPDCSGPGPIDITTSYTVWSALILTSWKSNPKVCCRSCGRKHQALGIVSSGLLGWWGFPWGLIMTPIQVIRNFVGLFGKYDPKAPTPEFENVVRLMVASDLVEQQRLENAQQEA